MEQIIENVAEQLNELLSEKAYPKIKALLGEINPIDIAALLENLPDEYQAVTFRLLPKDAASEVFIESSPELQEKLIASFSDSELKEIINDLFLDDTVDLIEEMPAHIVKRILKSASEEMRGDINSLLNYPKDSAGSIMTTEFVNLKKGMTVAQAFARIRKTGVDKETIYTCYVTEDDGRLSGIISARTLMLSQETDTVGELMEHNVISVTTADDKEEVARKIDKYGFLAMPVVDAENRLVGIVTIDDAMDILRQENTEDMSIMAAVTPSEKPYLKTGVFRIWLARVPWLLLLMVSATFTGWIISSNEAMLNMDNVGIILTAAIPMLMDTGGNAGSQTSVTVIRGLALEQIRFRDIFKVIFKEFRVSLLLGATLAVACFAKLMLIDRLYLNPDGLVVAGVICLAMFLTIVLAKFIGGALPLIAKKCRLDPAVVASPFITTIVDALSLIIYCNIAVALLA